MVLDVGLYDERQLMEVQEKDTYPLVIRLECVTDQGKADKHTLQVPRNTHVSYSPSLLYTPRCLLARQI